MRKRPPLTASGARQTWKVFGDIYKKEFIGSTSVATV